ncbi:MAG: hypothetical protein ACXVMS_14155 [Flavisolibacter sp.]
MKRFHFLSAVVVLVLMVTALSCTSMQGSQDGYYDRAASNRVYIDDPYRGTVVLERDPYTGRYYEVNSYGAYSSPYGYRNRVGNPYYSRRSIDNNHYRVYRNSNNNNHSESQEQTEQQKKEWNQKREEARKKILGN